MTVPVLFALIGGVILVGFLANLLFRVTKIPSVLVLVGIGVILGPLTGWLQHDALLVIAPFFGAVALLVILFEGGLELEVVHVLRHAPRAALFTAIVFALSLAAVASVAHFALGVPPALALMLGAILGATSPAICMPVVSGLSIREDVKTVIKLESALGEVLLIVSVVLIIESHHTGGGGAMSWIGGFARSLSVALVVATFAGVLWSRLVGWLGREPLSYMLTLGVTCLLYFVVEELGGSPAIAVLLFGLLLANMETIAERVGPHVRELFGIQVSADQFVLGQFMVNITAELSFLVRTFFFVYLGLLLDFSALSLPVAAWTAAMFGLLLVSRRVGITLFRRSGAAFSPGEWQAIMALQPRGLATAVVALMPTQAGIEGASGFPLFAFVIIILSNLFMTGGILFAERRLAADTHSADVQAAAAAVVVAAAPAVERLAEAPAALREDDEPTQVARRPPLFSPARDFEDEPQPTNVVDWIARVSGLRLADREPAFVDLLRASYLSEPLFWVQAVLGGSICALGLILGQTTIVVGGALIVPVARPVLTTGLALASGDLYLLLKLAAKLIGFSVVTIVASAVLLDMLPFAATMNEIVARTRPTILDLLVALFGGMSAAAVVSRRQGAAIQYLPGAVVGLTLVPALCVVGFSLSDALDGRVLRQAMLQFSANLFAAILGSALVLLALGVPRAARSPSIQQWKKDELATPIAAAIFRRLGIERAIGGTGSVRARVVAVGVFLLLLVTPLQLAFNQMRSELRARQAVADAIGAFLVPNRSAALGSTVVVTEGAVDVRLQVATNQLFTAADIAGFEQRVSKGTGRRVQLDLVQTVGDVGDAGRLQQMLERSQREPPAPSRTVHDAVLDAHGQIARVTRELPLPDGVQIVSVRSFSGPDGPGLMLGYLSETELGADARSLIVRLLAGRTELQAERIVLEWMPAMHVIRIVRGLPDAEVGVMLHALRTTLAMHPDLVVTLSVSDDTAAGVADRVAAFVQQRLGLEAPPQLLEPQGERRTATLRIGRRAV